MTTPDQKNARLAIEVMTARVHDLDVHKQFALERLVDAVEHRRDDDFTGSLDVIFGLMTLTGDLLGMRLTETGVSAEQTLRELALRYAD